MKCKTLQRYGEGAGDMNVYADLWCIESFDSSYEWEDSPWQLDFCPSPQMLEVFTRLFVNQGDAEQFCSHAKRAYPHLDFRVIPCAVVVGEKSLESLSRITHSPVHGEEG